MKLILPIFFVFIMILIPNWNFAQSINTLTKHILCDSDGNLNQNGSVSITLDPEGEPYQISVGSPCHEFGPIILSGSSFQIEATDPNEFETPPCPGEYCFDIVSNVGTDFECCKTVCTIVKKCIAREGTIAETYDCLEPFSPDLTENIFVNFEEENKIYHADIYPNPFLNDISLTFDTNFVGEVEIVLNNINGQRLYSENLNVVYGENNAQINDIDHLPSSIYFLHIFESKSKKILSIHKVVKP